MGSAHILVAILAVCLCPLTSAVYRRLPGSRGHPHRRLPQCRSGSQPCRLKAELVGNDPLVPRNRQLRRIISGLGCACPASSPCPSDWDQHSNRVIVRELRTNGNINMTFSMMFCTPVRVRSWCSRGDVALRLKGLSSVPTEVDDIPCSCSDSRPMVLQRQYRGPDFYQYEDYVCANHMRRCNVEWNPDTCLHYSRANETTFFPCKCPERTVCRSTSDFAFNKDFRCLPVMALP